MKLKADVERINKSDKIFMLADKTINIYETDPDLYEKMLRDNITDQYKKAPPTTESDITTEAKKIAEALEISERVEVMAKKESYITLKDHKC